VRLILRLRQNRWIKNHPEFSQFVKRVICFILKIVTLNMGINKNIAGQYYKFDYNFIFSDYSNWGSGHNSGFNSLLKLSKDKKVVFDIGAHIGLCAIPLSKVIHKKGKIYAFEPSVENLKYLRKNIKYNKTNSITIVPFLVGTKTVEKRDFYESIHVDGMNSIVKYKKSNFFIRTFKKQISLDDFFCDNNLIPDIIKIDVEGAEVDVLDGAFKLLKTHRPIIVLSVHPKQLKMIGKSVKDLKNRIDSLQYKVLDDHNNEITKLSFAEYVLYPI